MPATILIVEAHTLLRQALRGWMETTFSGYQVIEAASGAEAIAMTQTNSPDVVVLDLTLPDINGLEAAAHLREVAPATSVVILTNCEAEKQCARTRVNGASIFVVKNRITELRSTLATLLAS